MIKKKNKKSEFNHFTNLSDKWWDSKGEFKILHTLTPIRIKYIKSVFFNGKQLTKNTNKIFDNTKILDLGCGGGLICEPLARLGANVTGIDFVKENILVATKHAKSSSLKINYLHQDVENLKLRKKYDIILIFELLEHLENWKNLIITISKYLSKDGIVVISTINRNLLSKALAIFMAENILKWVPKNTHEYSKLIKPEELISFLNKNKFKVIDSTGLMYNPLLFQWQLNKNRNKVNYFCCAKKTN